MDWHWYQVTLQFRYVQVSIKPIVTLYRIAFVPVQKLYRIRLLFTHENGDFGVFSVMDRSCAARISKVESHISDRCSYYTGELLVSARKVFPYRMNIALIVETLRLIRLLYTHTHTNEQLRLPQEKEWRPVWGDVTRDDSQRPFLVEHSAAMLQQCCNHSKQCCNALLS